MGAVAFNTYEFIKSLTDAGIEEEQAAAISAGILRAHEVADLATKADLRELQAQTKADFNKLQANFNELRAEFREFQTQTKADLRELELRMTVKLGSMLIIAVGVLGAMMKLL